MEALWLKSQGLSHNEICRLTDLSADTLRRYLRAYQGCALVQELAGLLHIELLFLPASSPNLNLIEQLWKLVKKHCLYAKYYPDFEPLKAAITQCLNQTHTVHKEALVHQIFFHMSNLKSLPTLDGWPPGGLTSPKPIGAQQ